MIRIPTVVLTFADGHVKSVKKSAWVTTASTPVATDPVWVNWDPAQQK